MHELQILECKHCGNKNFVATCRCGRYFVITKAHLKGKARKQKDKSPRKIPKDFIPGDCDFCMAKAKKIDETPLAAGLRQPTCPDCNTEFLKAHKLNDSCKL